MKKYFIYSLVIVSLASVQSFAKGGGAWDFEGNMNYQVYKVLVDLVYDATRVSSTNTGCEVDVLANFIQSFQNEYAELKDALQQTLDDKENTVFLPQEKTCLENALVKVQTEQN